MMMMMKKNEKTEKERKKERKKISENPKSAVIGENQVKKYKVILVHQRKRERERGQANMDKGLYNNKNKNKLPHKQASKQVYDRESTSNLSDHTLATVH